jgi:putative heme-binding domain-containing protein
VRIVDRQHAEEHLVHEREDRGIGADAERDRNSRDGGDTGGRAPGADGKPDVCEQAGSWGVGRETGQGGLAEGVWHSEIPRFSGRDDDEVAIMPGVKAAVAVSAVVVFAAAIGSSAQDRAATKGGDAPPPVQRVWTVKDLLPSVGDLGIGHDWNQGRELFRKAGCGLCHAFASESEGTGFAPDLTGVASTFTRDAILQSIVEPSATINGRFFQTTFTLKNGQTVTGTVVDVADGKIHVAPVLMNPQVTVPVAEADVKSEQPSPVSAMPAGLLNEFTREQVVELMAFLDAGGDRAAAVYKKK